MRMLWLTILYTAATPAQGYGASWLDLPSSQPPSFQRPVDVITDVINDFGVRILQEYGETGRSGNVAFSPTGIGFVLAALYEGSAGPGNEQIAHALGLPRDKDVTRIGLRDIHRRLRSYLSPDGFLGGLTLNRENTKLRADYEDILKFLGFDVSTEDDRTNATSVSETPSGSTNVPTLPCRTEKPESPVTLTTLAQESNLMTTTVTSGITDSPTSTTLAPEDVSETTTAYPKDSTTTSISPEEKTTSITDLTTAEPVEEATTVASSTQKGPDASEEVSSTVEVTTKELTTVPSITTAVPTTTESLTSVSEVSSRLMETSATSTEETPFSTQPTTMVTTVNTSVGVTEDMKSETTLASVEKLMESTTATATAATTTEDEIASETTSTSVLPETSTETMERLTTVSLEEKEETSLEPGEASEESREELATTVTEENVTEEPAKEFSNEIIYDSTTGRIDVTTLPQVAKIETTTDAMNTESEIPVTLEDKDVDVENTTTSSDLDMKPSKLRRVRKIGIEDPVVKTLLDARAVKPDIKGAGDEEIENLTGSSTSEETIIKGKRKTRETRRSARYFSSFSNLPDFPSFPIYPDFFEYPESSWTRKVGGWRVHSPKIDEVSPDSTEMTFLVNGEDATIVPAAAYTVVLPFAFLPALQALALEFPLDDPRYNILLILPTDRDGTRRLARDLGAFSLRELRKELQPAWVRAIIPSFMLKGFVTLTPFLQRLGIKDVFEPRDADLSPMTDDVGVYARDVQQSIGVNIRNYMKPDRTHSRNGLFERAGPVSFVAEHPFLFFIIDAETGVSLIAGRIEDPLNSRIL